MSNIGTLISSVLINIKPSSAEEEEDTTSEELGKITQTLRYNLNELDAFEKVDLVTKVQAPKGTKDIGDLITWSSLFVSFVATSGMLPLLINAIQSWLGRNGNNSITIEIDGGKLHVTGITTDQLKRGNNSLSCHSFRKL